MASKKGSQLPVASSVADNDSVIIVTETSPTTKRSPKSVLLQGLATVTELVAGLATKANIDHTQTASTITDFDTSVTNNPSVTANTAKNSYPSADATKLADIATGATANDTDDNLKNRANHTGTQPASTVSDFNSSADARITAQKGQANGLATLGFDSKVPTSQLPAIAVTDVSVVPNQATQLTLTAQEGDIVIRSDLNKSYIHNGGATGTMGDWSELLTPTDAVLSVNGQTGSVSLAKGDIGLSNVPNTDATSRSNHTGTQSADTFTDGTANKVYTSIDKTKLSGIASGATVNSTDAQLRDRSTHIGIQPASSISNFDTQVRTSRLDQMTVPSAAVSMNGKKLTNLAIPTATQDAVTLSYIASRGESLVTNWAGFLGSNVNFSTFTFRPDAAPVGASGSFQYQGGGSSRSTDEFMSINPNTVYQLDVSLKPDNQSPVEKQYVGLAFFDNDGLSIPPLSHMYVENNEVYLSRDFTPGVDDKMYLTADPGWSFNGTNVFNRGVIFWDWVSATGQIFPPFTYSRNYNMPLWDKTTNNLASFNGTDWEIPVKTSGIGAVSGIRLSGTRVSICSSSGLYKYITVDNQTPINNVWNHYSGYIGGVDTTGRNKNNSFPPGAATVKILFLVNYNGNTPDNKILISNVHFNRASRKHLGVAVSEGSATVKGSYYPFVESVTSTLPPSSTADTNGKVGDIAWDNTYVYVKTAVGWKRSALSTF